MAVLEKLREFVLSDKGRKILIAAALAAMLLLLLSTASCGGKGAADTTSQDIASEDIPAMEKALEKRLETLLSKMDGVGSVSVMITLDTSSEKVYEQDTKVENSSQSSSGNELKSRKSETEVVLAGSAKQPLQTGTVQPKVRGAAIVCSGASDPIVRERVANAAAKALDLGISRVYVTC